MSEDTGDPFVSARGVRKVFEDHVALDGVDLSVHEDELLLLLGPNGSGKTILLSCLAGGLSPTEGEIDVFGRDPADAGASTSFMLQDGLAFPQLTGRETLDFYTDLHPSVREDWPELAERLGIADELDREVGDYSGGMMRKLELAIAFAVDAPLYFLDEPTAELDMTTVDTVHALVEERRDAGSTVVLASHRPVDVTLADRVAFVREGKVSETGDPEALMDDVPQVVVERVGVDLDDFVRDGRFFETEGERRGFLAAGVETEAVREAGGRTEDPTVGDMFNFYVHLQSAT